MYVRLKEVKGQIYGQIVSGYRDEAGRVRQRNIIGLGQNCDVEGALDDVDRDLGRCRRRLKKLSPSIRQMGPTCRDGLSAKLPDCAHG